MKLYVWEDVLQDLTSGIMFAVAESVEEAMAAILRECDYVPASDLQSEPAVYDLTNTKSLAWVVWGGG